METLKEKAHIFGLIFTLSNRLQVLGDKFDENLTIKQWLLLVAIFKFDGNSPTISEVASLIGNSRQSVKKMALILEKEGFIKLIKDTMDRRSLRFELTQKCKDYLKQREQAELEFLMNLYDGFDNNLLKSLDEGITKLEENIMSMEKQYEQNER